MRIVLFCGLSEILSLEAASQIALWDCSEKIRKEAAYIGIFVKKKKKDKHVVEQQKIIAN